MLRNGDEAVSGARFDALIVRTEVLDGAEAVSREQHAELLTLPAAHDELIFADTLVAPPGKFVALRDQQESAFRIAIDSRGHGKSSNTAPVPIDEMLSDDVVGVMNARGIARADIVGWSDGGNLGLDLARRYPDRVDKVVAFGANRTPPPDGQDAAQTKAFKEAKPDAAMFMPLRYFYEKNSPTPDKWPEFFQRERAMVFAGPHWSLDQLATIRAPVLLLNGEHDLVLLSYAMEMKNAIPGARLEIVRGEAHELPLSNPGAANPIMLAFLRQKPL